jgi:hypothetical protein
MAGQHRGQDLAREENAAGQVKADLFLDVGFLLEFIKPPHPTESRIVDQEIHTPFPGQAQPGDPAQVLQAKKISRKGQNL